MKNQIDLRGASGAVYRYKLAEAGDPRTTISGNYIYVREVRARPVVIYAGQTNNLMTGVKDQWAEAQAQHGATHIYVRFNVSGRARKEEQEDLIAELEPPMNDKPAKPRDRGDEPGIEALNGH